MNRVGIDEGEEAHDRQVNGTWAFAPKSDGAVYQHCDYLAIHGEASILPLLIMLSCVVILAGDTKKARQTRMAKLVSISSAVLAGVIVAIIGMTPGPTFERHLEAVLRTGRTWDVTAEILMLPGHVPKRKDVV